MKFFISFICINISMNLCQSYQNTRPFIIIPYDQRIDIADGTMGTSAPLKNKHYFPKNSTEEWLTITKYMKKPAHKNLCNSIIESQFFIPMRTQLNDNFLLMNRNELISKKNELGIVVSIIKEEESVAAKLRCSIGNLLFFDVILTKKHITYIQLPGFYKPIVIGIATKSYTYQQSSPEIREQIWQSLKSITSERKLEVDSRLPLYSLNDYNRRKLCATIVNIPIPEIVNENPENRKNFTLEAQLQEQDFHYLDFSVVGLQCRLYDHVFKSTIFYIAQLPNQENRVIILGYNTIDVYDIHEFEAGSSSSG